MSVVTNGQFATIALAPGAAEFLRSQAAGNFGVFGIAQGIINARNNFYVGAVCTAIATVGALYSGNTAVAASACVGAVATTAAAKTLYDRTAAVVQLINERAAEKTERENNP